MITPIEDQVVQKRLEVLQLANELGNVSEACRRLGISRTQFYVYKRRYKSKGIDGLRDNPPVHHSHPRTTPQDVENQVVALSLEHPAWGCDRLAELLEEQDINLSSQTVQNIRRRNKIGTRRDRRLKLEKLYQDPAALLSVEQTTFLEKQNPAFGERNNESSRPGEILSQYMFSIGRLVYVGRVYLHAVIDTYSNYAFAILNTSKRAEAAAAILNETVLPFFDQRELTVKAILTNNGREFCGKKSHPYERFLTKHHIEHWHSTPGTSHTSGFLARFRSIVLAEFFGDAFRNRFYRSVADLQADLNIWLVYYNTVRSHQGYPNRGLSPYESIGVYLSQREERHNNLAETTAIL